jgi:pimeloyl-ACP methyl ester carboxylesterase
MAAKRGEGEALWLFLGGVLAGAAGTVLAQALTARRPLDPSLLGPARHDPSTPPVVIVPGILGSELLRPDGTHLWLNLRNALGHHDLTLPFRLPFTESRDDLVPGGLVGVDTVLPRVFGFTEYADLLQLLASAGFRRDAAPAPRTLHVFTYDWRRDLVESARRLGEWLDERAAAAGDPGLRFNVIGHSMGALVARYYLRYGGVEPGSDLPVTWAGAKRIRSLALVAPPNAGSIGALDAILNGSRVGLSYTTLAASVVSRMPSIYELLPPPAARPLIDGRGRELDADLYEISTWDSLGWGPFRPFPPRRRGDESETGRERDWHLGFLEAALERARALQEALSVRPETPCPVRVTLLGGDCLPTPARVIVQGPRGTPPRFDPWTRAESQLLLEAGDGRVTRSSAAGAHLPGAEDSESGTGYAEVAQAVFGDAEHHAIYAQPTFQSLLLRQLLRGTRRAVAAA